MQQLEDRDIEWIARNVDVIAVVGLSPNETRPSWGVARYLQAKGKTIIPVNPGHAGGTILGRTVYASLTDIPKDAGVQMVDVFRQSSAVAGIVDEALTNLPDLKVIWTQLGVRDDVAAAKAGGAGVTVVQDRCPKIEFPRFL
ncbi:CoA-binding protein [Paracoccus indicus]|uniref:CoA-binding protein n=1 Tax=Paracoccus indicus TaxID=2079229 RepID=UPI001B8CA0BC|nr:CoA-binding protein [Paracoccus indicus]